MEEALRNHILPNDILTEMARFEIVQKSKPKREKLHLLVVEDQRFTRTLLYKVLRLYGNYIIDTTADAREALHLYLKNAHDIAFLDIELAGESGHTLARIIREVDESAYIVMVTASHAARDIDLAKSNKVDGFITKPFSKDKIFKSIEKYMSWKASGKRGLL